MRNTTNTGSSRSTLLWHRGTLRMNARGFGFVDTGADEDLFVPSKLLTGLLDGDEVRAATRTSGDQVRRIERTGRARTEIVGTMNLDGTATIDPGVGVGNATIASGTAPAGHAVILRADGDKWRLVADLGDAFGNQAVVSRFMYRHQLPVGHSPEVVAAAEQLANSPVSRLGLRRDMRDQLVVTIDDDTSYDLDDALSASGAADGSIRVWVHIADVAGHVSAGSPIDEAARSTPTSVYLPQAVRHMLPPTLGTGRLSLLPGVERDTLCVELRVNPDGEIRGVDLYEARIRSRRRLSYTTTANVLAGSDTDTDTDTAEMLRVLRTAAARLGVQRAARGGLDSARADQGEARGDDEAHLLIERLMVATNEAVASWLTDRGMPCLWRAHDPLAGESVHELEKVAAGFGLYAGFGDKLTPRSLAALVTQVPAGSSGAAFWDALLSLLGRARYTGEPGGHFGLGSDGYLHFTSPLRRYPDLLTHRIVKSYLAGERDPGRWESKIAEVAEQANLVSRQAAWAERDASLFERLSLLEKGSVTSATVVGGARGGVRVRLDDNGARGGLARELPAGARVKVRITACEPFAGKLELSADTSAGKSAGGSARKSGTTKGPQKRSTPAAKRRTPDTSTDQVDTPPGQAARPEEHARLARRRAPRRAEKPAA